MNKMSSQDILDSEKEDELHHVNLTKRLHEKQQELEELSKKMRYMELESKKKEIESRAELQNER